MTQKQKAEASARRELVRAVRMRFRPHFFMNCLEVAYRVIPRCKSCEYFTDGHCTAPPGVFFDHPPEDGKLFKNGDRLCIQWSPSPAAIMSALNAAYPQCQDSTTSALEIPSEPAQPHIKPGPKEEKIATEALTELAKHFWAGEINAQEAAVRLGVSTSHFYWLLRKLNPEDFNITPVVRKKAGGRPSTIDLSELAEKIHLFQAGEISGPEAAEALGIPVKTFYSRVRTMTPREESEAFMEEFRRYNTGEITAAQAADNLNISRTSFYQKAQAVSIELKEHS